MPVDLRVIEAATYEPVTVEFFKQHARLGGDEVEPDDSESLNLPAYIKAARLRAERETGQILTDALYELRLPHLCPPICLPVSPVGSVELITYLDADGVRQDLSATDYVLDDHPWHPRIATAYGQTWPTGGRGGYGSAVIRFRGAYSEDNPAPEDFKIAICLMASHWYENREEVVVGTIASAMPMAAAMLLDENRRTVGV